MHTSASYRRVAQSHVQTQITWWGMYGAGCRSFMPCVQHCIYNINVHLHAQLNWQWAWMQWGERFPSHAFPVFSLRLCMQNGSAACLAVRPEQHTLWEAGNPCTICLFIWTSRWSQKHHMDSYTAVSFGLLSSFISISHKISGKCCTSRYRSCSKYLSCYRGHLFSVKVGSVSLKPVWFQFLVPSHSTRIYQSCNHESKSEPDLLSSILDPL